ncbi:hypothetical protein WMF20_31875 [Sorangium sp. So ce834]|uniref:hypothetical protein n=1 Tax=Sorangium sp. So ce834 TaxID=3133321 RepID=UPI003F5EB4D4
MKQEIRKNQEFEIQVIEVQSAVEEQRPTTSPTNVAFCHHCCHSCGDRDGRSRS